MLKSLRNEQPIAAYDHFLARPFPLLHIFFSHLSPYWFYANSFQFFGLACSFPNAKSDMELAKRNVDFYFPLYEIAFKHVHVCRHYIIGENVGISCNQAPPKHFARTQFGSAMVRYNNNHHCCCSFSFYSFEWLLMFICRYEILKVNAAIWNSRPINVLGTPKNRFLLHTDFSFHWTLLSENKSN